MMKQTNKFKACRSRNVLVYMTASLLFMLIHIADAAPKAILWAIWLDEDQHSTIHPDHGKWDRFLHEYIYREADGINRVKYGQVNEQDRRLLNEYLSYLSGIPVRKLSRTEQLPYWINLYNAVTVKVILDYYPVKSIRDIDISPGWFTDGPWGKKILNIEGHPVSLDDIEHRILRPIWKDPRIHYAVNCAAIGCPNLQENAFTTENTEHLLEKGAHEYVNHPRGVRIQKGMLVVSSIYKWFGDDFGSTDKKIIEHLKKYAIPDLQLLLKKYEVIGDFEYEWALNDLK